MTDFDYTPTKAEAKECFLDGAQDPSPKKIGIASLGWLSQRESPQTWTPPITPPTFRMPRIASLMEQKAHTMSQIGKTSLCEWQKDADKN